MPMKRPHVFPFLMLVFVLIGCGPKYIDSSLPPQFKKHSIQEVGLLPFIVKPQKGGELRSGTVAPGATAIITDQFYQNLVARHVPVVRWEGNESLDSNTDALSDVERAQRIGRILKTSTVLFGYVSTFAEREGSAIGIQKPASVGFSAELIHTEDGHLLWKGGYHETQKNLFEDISAYRLFFKRHGRWLTASELSEDGIEQLMAVSPWAKLKAE
jgi:hypothetical protein